MDEIVSNSNLNTTKLSKVTLGPRYFLASNETIAAMEKNWNKLYPDKPFSIDAFYSEIMKKE